MFLEERIDDKLLADGVASDLPDQLTTPPCLRIGIARRLCILVMILVDLEENRRQVGGQRRHVFN